MLLEVYIKLRVHAAGGFLCWFQCLTLHHKMNVSKMFLLYVVLN